MHAALPTGVDRGLLIVHGLNQVLGGGSGTTVCWESLAVLSSTRKRQESEIILPAGPAAARVLLDGLAAAEDGPLNAADLDLRGGQTCPEEIFRWVGSWTRC